jgi:hypothetical protein
MALERGEGCIQYKFHNPDKGGMVEDKIGYGMNVSDKVWASSGTYLVRK